MREKIIRVRHEKTIKKVSLHDHGTQARGGGK
jgi:hypothetical protein